MKTHMTLALVLGLLGIGCAADTAPFEIDGEGYLADALGDAGVESVEQAIINSVDVPASEEKHMVKIEGSAGACSASFLRPGLIITADHCPSGSDLVVRPGTTGFDANRTPKRLDARAIGGKVDLKLVKVTTDYNPSVNIELASDCDLVGKVVTVYGRKKNTSDSEDDGFRKRDMTVRDVRTYAVGKADGSQVWTFTGFGTGPVGVPGDSGGPSYLNGQLVGINSGGGEHADSVMASVCHYRNELIQAASQLGFDLTKPFSTSLFDSQMTAKCADADAGQSLSNFKSCIANHGIPYVKDHNAWKLNVVIHCDKAVLGGGVQSYNPYWQCLKDRDVTFDNNAAWQSAVKKYCQSAVVGGGYKNYNAYKQCLSDRKTPFAADTTWCNGVHNYCKAQWYPFGGKDKCYTDRSCGAR